MRNDGGRIVAAASGARRTDVSTFAASIAATNSSGRLNRRRPSSSHRSHGSAASHAPHDHSHHDHAAATVKPSAAAKYFCPMCPGVESDKPGDCPKCGMALERNPAWVAPASGKTIYTCPMHPEVQQDHPGDCPICGMPLEPMTATAATDDEENAELRDMTQRFWIGAALTLPVFVLAMAHLVPALAAQAWADSHASRWIQFALTTPVVAWAGWPFFRRGWRSLRDAGI